MGGEPLVLPWLPDLINKLNEIGTLYTIITNCVDKDALENLINKTQFIRGFTASCDVTDGEYDAHRKAKSSIGYKTLVWMKEKYKDRIDCCAEVTTNKYNIHLLPNLIDKLEEHEIYSSISVIDPKLNEYYDFSNIAWDDVTFVEKDPRVREIFNYAQKSQYIHMPKLLDYLYEDLPYAVQDIRDLMMYISIDSDLSVRYSLRQRGISVPNCVKIKDLMDMKNDEELMKKVRNIYWLDQTRFDEGFNWSGIYMAKAIRLGAHNIDDKVHNLYTKEN